MTVRLEESEVTAGWVVGADGAHSVVRKALGIGFPGVPIVERFLLADVHADIDRPRDAAPSCGCAPTPCWPPSRYPEPTCGE